GDGAEAVRDHQPLEQAIAKLENVATSMQSFAKTKQGQRVEGADDDVDGSVERLGGVDGELTGHARHPVVERAVFDRAIGGRRMSEREDADAERECDLAGGGCVHRGTGSRWGCATLGTRRAASR